MRNYFFVKSSFKHTREECESTCELLFLFCVIASWTWEVMCVMMCHCMFCVALSMDLFVLSVACLTVFVNCLVKLFAICLGVFVILLLNVMELLSVVGGALLDRPCMVFHRMCVLWLWSQCAPSCSFHMLCLCFCMSEVISLFAISMMVVKIMLAVCILVGMVVWAKVDSVSSVNCVQSAFL